MSGVIYILTNPSFPEYVKIGYADDIDSRLSQLNRSECIPFAFRVYATYEVNNRLVDLKLHDLIDRLNPTLRSIETFNGKQRKREFYAMSPEAAYALLEAIAEIHGCTDKLKLWEMDANDVKAEEEAQEISEERKERLSPFTFSKCNIKPGDAFHIISSVFVKRKIIYSEKKIIERNMPCFSSHFTKFFADFFRKSCFSGSRTPGNKHNFKFFAFFKNRLCCFFNFPFNFRFRFCNHFRKSGRNALVYGFCFKGIREDSVHKNLSPVLFFHS